MRLSRKPSAVRRRRLLLSCLLIIIGLSLALFFRSDPTAEFAKGLGFIDYRVSDRAALRLPDDLSQPPYDSCLSASRAAGLDFAALAGRKVTVAKLDIGQIPGLSRTVTLNVLLDGRRVAGAYLTGVGADGIATPINAPDLLLEPLNPR